MASERIVVMSLARPETVIGHGDRIDVFTNEAVVVLKCAILPNFTKTGCIGFISRIIPLIERQTGGRSKLVGARNIRELMSFSMSSMCSSNESSSPVPTA